MKGRYVALGLWLWLLPGMVQSQAFYDFNPNCQKAYSEIISLKLTEGLDLLRQEKREHPGNLIALFLENYIDFFSLYFNEDPVQYHQKESLWEIRMKTLNQGPPTSPYYLFCKSMGHFQWAAIQIKFGNFWAAGLEFRKSFLQIEQNRERFPRFSPNPLIGGPIEVAASTIPAGYHWLASLLGIHGTLRQGLDDLQGLTNTRDSLGILFRKEALFYSLYLRFYILNERSEVLQDIQGAQWNLDQDALLTFLTCNLALNGQRSDWTESILTHRTTDSAFLDLPILDYFLGSARINHLQQDANLYLERFVRSFKGGYYVKDALQKLSWHYFLQGDLKKARYYNSEILHKGSTFTEADKAALKEARKGIWPNPILLQARLLNDGGYFHEALEKLKGKSSSSFHSQEERLEFAYRLGRIYDDLNRIQDAKEAYLTTIKLGENSTAYYAARAALQMGFLYERMGNCMEARAYFQKCLDLQDHDFKNSLDQKAKAGLNRCHKKD